ncbi:hypothetical protein DAETH_48470 (plasmid) [Deinococcus aetherius]|uniref:Uncharacterized protein n=1 Tax=Deinococcus aetherius TaxID=200252 RepID=A0ABN6RNM6_9DEIO|nr:hypothetical protein [Deinococcus aetherius]BDP44878.1 hypothetical protein DAETH_48470 [Deinococcus aetherius]
MKISRPATPAVLAVGQMHITGNITPHVWYHRSEFRTSANRPNRNMLTIAGDLLYWHRPEEVRDEEQGGIFVGYARKFQRDLLQYNYGRRGAVFGMSDREVSDACLALQRAGLIHIHYRTERIKGKLLHNVVYIELIPEAFAATLAGPDVGPVVKAKGAKRGRHAKAGSPDDVSPVPTSASQEVPDETAGVDDEGDDDDLEGDPEEDQGDPLPEGTTGTSQNFGELTSQNLEDQGTKFRDTYYESSSETSSPREFGGGAFQAEGDARAHEPGSSEVSGDQDTHSSSGDAALSTDEAGPDLPAPEAPEPSLATGSGSDVHEPPDGGAADAADGEAPARSLEEIRRMFEDTPSQTTDPENIPGAAAGGVPREGADGPVVAGVEDLAPLAPQELSSRLPAPPESEVHQALREVIGKGLTKYLGEDTRTGCLPRGEYWPRLTLEEIEEVKRIAQAEARRTQGNMITLAARGFDRLIGAVKAPRVKEVSPGKPRETSPQHGGYNGGALLPAKKAEVDATPEEGRYSPGARWRHKTTQEVLTLTATEMTRNRTTGVGAKFVLTGGVRVSSIELVRDYQFEGRFLE